MPAVSEQVHFLFPSTVTMSNNAEPRDVPQDDDEPDEW